MRAKLRQNNDHVDTSHWYRAGCFVSKESFQAAASRNSPFSLRYRNSTAEIARPALASSLLQAVADGELVELGRHLAQMYAERDAANDATGSNKPALYWRLHSPMAIHYN
jgi:hypothetical protein